MKLSEHFTLAEFEFSQTAIRHGIDNRLPPELYDNARRICALLEEARAVLQKPIHITSGYRCPDLNVRIGGAGKSAHMEALAADFVAPAFGTPLEITEILASVLKDFDQLIYEGTWVHIGLMNGPHQRREVLTAKFDRGRARYLPGIVA
jgi:hypothetical protein